MYMYKIIITLITAEGRDWSGDYNNNKCGNHCKIRRNIIVKSLSSEDFLKLLAKPCKNAACVCVSVIKYFN